MIWGSLFGRNASKDKAKKRLTMVLSYERKGLSPNFAEKLKEDLLYLLSKYPQFEGKKIEVNIRSEDEDFNQICISVPFKK